MENIPTHQTRIHSIHAFECESDPKCFHISPAMAPRDFPSPSYWHITLANHPHSSTRTLPGDSSRLRLQMESEASVNDGSVHVLLDVSTWEGKISNSVGPPWCEWPPIWTRQRRIGTYKYYNITNVSPGIWTFTIFICSPHLQDAISIDSKISVVLFVLNES